MRRRDFLTASAAAAAGSTLAGCRPTSGEGSTSTAYTPGGGNQWAPAGDADVPGLLGTAHQSVWGKRGVVAAADYYASLAGVQILMQGGNAVDAIVAACATLNVSEPYMSGIGGFGGFMLIYLAEEQRVVALDAIGNSPAAASAETITKDDISAGVRAPIVPAALKGWAAALEAHGTMSLGDVLEPAIQLAEDGFVVSKFDQAHMGSSYDKLAQFPTTARVFAPNGRAPRMGEIIKQPDLASSMRHLARVGADDFYRGELADRVVSFVAENGGIMTKEDLASYEVRWREPITTTFQGHTLHALPPGSCGMTMFQTLNVMDGFGLDSIDLYGSDFVHSWLEAMKNALIDDDLHNTGKNVDIPVDRLISQSYADEQRTKIRPGQIAAFHGEPFPFHGTTSLSAADRWGNAVAFTQSLVSVFGSGVIAGDTGIFLNNGHTFGFSLDSSDHANYIAGGERAKGVMTPCLVMRDGKCLAAVGAAGGYTIPQTVGQVITKLLAGGMDIQLAIASPRHLINRGGGLTPIPEDSVTYLENGYPAEVYADLASRGHHLAAPGNPGGVQAVYIDQETGALAGGSDPRRDGHAIAW